MLAHGVSKDLFDALVDASYEELATRVRRALEEERFHMGYAESLTRRIVVTGEGAAREALARLVPFTASLAPRGGAATAFVCVDRTCRLPVTTPADFAAQLESTEPGVSER